MVGEYTRAMRLGVLRIEQTDQWLKKGDGFRDTVVLSTTSNEPNQMVAIVSLDDLVAFVTWVREEWREQRNRGLARVVRT